MEIDLYLFKTCNKLNAFVRDTVNFHDFFILLFGERNVEFVTFIIVPHRIEVEHAVLLKRNVCCCI